MNRRGILSQPRLVFYFIAIIYLVFFSSRAYSDLNSSMRIVHQSLITLFLSLWLILLLRKRSEIPVTALDFSLIAFLTIRLVSAFFGMDTRVSLESLWRPFTHLLIFYFLVWLFQRRGWRLFSHAFYLTAGVVCIVALIEFLSWYVGISILPIFQEGWLQIGGLSNPIPPVNWRLNFTLTNATSLSAFLTLLIPPALAFGLTGKSRDSKIGWFGWVGVALVVLVLTRSRSGILALLVSLPVFTLAVMNVYWTKIMSFTSQNHTRLLFRIVVIALVGLILFLVVMVAPIYLRRMSTVEYRLEMWRCALNMVSDHPMFGVGPANYGHALRACLSFQTTAFEQFATAHNLYLNVAAESGLVGLVALGWLLVSLLRLGWRRWKCAGTTRDRLLVAGFFAALAGYAANCLVDTLPETPLVLPVVYLTAWLAYPECEEGRAGSNMTVLAPLAALILLIGSFVGLLRSDQAQWLHDRSRQAASRDDLDSALAAINQAREIDPAMYLYDFQRAYYLGRLAEIDPEHYLGIALDAAKDTIHIDDTYSLHFANLAALLWQAGDQDAAISSMRRAVEANPPNSVFQFNLGIMLEADGQREGAIQAYSETLDRNPEWAGSGFWRSNDFRQDALNEIILQSVVDRNKNAELEFYTGFPERAVSLLENPTNTAGYVLLGRALCELGDYNASLDAFNKANEMSPANGNVYTFRSELYRLMGQYDNAEQDARIALFISPYGSSQVHYTLGQINLEWGDIQGAKEQFWQARSPQFASQNWEVVLYNRRAMLLPLGQLSSIGGGVRQAQAWFALADLYHKEEQLTDAENIYRALLLEDPYFYQAQERLDEILQIGNQE
ncbi:MAG: O-antigen ligase family protein [Anaerolineales bacterium]|nr:O-antigen ligase family protein [Anaerolineales bacterium]